MSDTQDENDKNTRSDISLSNLRRSLCFYILFSVFTLPSCNYIPVPSMIDPYQIYLEGGAYESGKIGYDSKLRSIYFSSPVSGRGDIYKAQLAGQSYTVNSIDQISFHQNYERDSYLVSDGLKLFFNRFSDEGTLGIWQRSLPSGNEKEISPNRYSSIVILDASADGSFIIISESKWKGGMALIVENFLLNVHSLKKQSIGMSPKFSKKGDSTTLVYASYEEDQQADAIYTLDYKSGVSLRVAAGSQPKISKNGSHIAYQDPKSSTWFVSKINGMGKTKLIQSKRCLFSQTADSLYLINDNANTISVYNFKGALINKASLPQGRVSNLLPTDFGLLFVLHEERDKIGMIYSFDEKKNTFHPIIKIDGEIVEPKIREIQ